MIHQPGPHSSCFVKWPDFVTCLLLHLAFPQMHLHVYPGNNSLKLEFIPDASIRKYHSLLHFFLAEKSIEQIQEVLFLKLPLGLTLYFQLAWEMAPKPHLYSIYGTLRNTWLMEGHGTFPENHSANADPWHSVIKKGSVALSVGPLCGASLSHCIIG